MPNFFITTSSTTAQSLGDGQTGFVGQGATLYTNIANAVTMTGSATLTALGSIVGDASGGSQGSAVALGSAATGARIVVGQDGTLLSLTAGAVSGTVSDQLFVQNAGLVSGNTSAIRIVSLTTSGVVPDHYIVNTGSIQSNSSLSGDNTIQFTTPSNGFLSIGNAGTILNAGGGSAISMTGGRLELTNAGTIQAEPDGAAIVTAGGADDVLNTGTIIGNVNMEGGNDLVENTGAILGNLNLGDGADALFNTGAILGNLNLGDGADALFNTGTIRGNISMATAETAGAAQDLVANAGLIDGSILLGGGDDTFRNEGGRVTGTIDGGEGNDSYTLDRTDLAVSDSGINGIDTVTALVDYAMGPGIEMLFLSSATGLRGTGSNGNDQIAGSQGDDTIRGGEGDDVLDGGLGDDRVSGGRGNDAIVASGDFDNVHGGGGFDIIRVLSGNADLDGGSGIDVLDLVLLGGTGAAVDLARGTASQEETGDWTLANIENVNGSGSGDTIAGSNGSNSILGQAGADVIDGGKGADLIDGGAGSDTLAGGSGSDVFVFAAVAHSAPAAPDLITDFSRNADFIDLSSIDADGAGAVDAFTFVGSGPFNGLGAQVRFTADAVAGLTTIEIRLAGSAANDMVILLTGAVDLTADNFAL